MVTEKPNRKDNILKYASAVALYSQRLRNEFIANYKLVQSEQQPEVKGDWCTACTIKH